MLKESTNSGGGCKRDWSLCRRALGYSAEAEQRAELGKDESLDSGERLGLQGHLKLPVP